LKQAKKYGLRNGQIVQVEIKGVRGLVFNKVEVKINENYELAMHIDTDEANACGIKNRNSFGKVILK
jgi:putative phosphotransacetylase